MSFQIEIRNNHVTLEGVHYFRANASSLRLGSWGEKKSPLTQQNYLMLEGHVPAPKLQVRKGISCEIAGARLTDQDIGLTLTVPGVGKLSAGVAAEQLRSNQLKLVKFEVLPKNLAAAANESPAVIDGLRRVGNDGRLVHQVLVALDAKTAALYSTAGTIDAEIDGGKFSLTAHVGAGGSGGTTLSFEDATFAYLLLKPKWDASQKKNWTRIVDWDDDQWSLN